jgi:hypothetical protein
MDGALPASLIVLPRQIIADVDVAAKQRASQAMAP